MRAGIDLGGTKTEIIVLDNGLEVYRQRQATPADDYPSLLQSLVRLFHQAKMDLQQTHLSLGLG
ncbi:MAG: ROK family protein, partial [Gammaproteobacteria bacterium]|nr:ROK family protein [Gammaproteobacteria bacterium]